MSEIRKGIGGSMKVYVVIGGINGLIGVFGRKSAAEDAAKENIPAWISETEIKDEWDGVRLSNVIFSNMSVTSRSSAVR